MTLIPVSEATAVTGRSGGIIRGWARDGKITAEKRTVNGYGTWFVDPDTFPPRPQRAAPDGVCRRCDRHIKIANQARILCGTCVTQATKLSELEDYPMSPTRSDILIEEFPRMRDYLGHDCAIDRLAVVYGLHRKQVRQVIHRHFPPHEFKEAA